MDNTNTQTPLPTPNETVPPVPGVDAAAEVTQNTDSAASDGTASAAAETAQTAPEQGTMPATEGIGESALTAAGVQDPTADSGTLPNSV
jgi:hypothetical protein